MQALEKYFKAILLYNRQPATGLGHNITAAFERVQSIPDIPFSFPQGLDEFIKHLNEEGPNRYFEYPAVATGEELLHLDRTVWYVRRFCQYLHGSLRSKHGEIERFPIEIARIQHFSKDKPHKFRIWGGFIERVLDRGPNELREQLTSKNPFYGRRHKKVLRRYTFHSWSAYPTTSLYPEVYLELKDLIDFSKQVKEYLEQELVKKTGLAP